jgi:pimeloyl-ACP methyl ester carboxylesterase
VSDVSERHIQVNGRRCRVQEKGTGAPLGFLGGLRGLPRWPALLDRLASRRRVIAPSLPGFPGATGFDELDDLADWVTATLDLLEASGLDGADLVGASVGATLAAEVACFSRASVRRLVLIAPFGLFDEREPVKDLWATRPDELPALLSQKPAELAAFLAPPTGEDALEWSITMTRASEAAARLLWPTGDLGLRKRLHRIKSPTLVLWGGEDRIVPPSYAKRFAAALGGWVEAREIAGAGHMAELDQPDAIAAAILGFSS